MQRLIKVDGKVRTDSNFPAGFMDVVTIEKTGEHFRLIYDVKGRFTIHRISAEEAKVSRNEISWNMKTTFALFLFPYLWCSISNRPLSFISFPVQVVQG